METLSSSETKPLSGGRGGVGNNKPLDPNAKEWSPKINGAREEDRCLFITFSNGHPIPEHKIMRFFRLKYGDCLERVYVHWPAPQDVEQTKISTPQFGKVVFKNSLIPSVLTLCGQKSTKFIVDGKPLCDGTGPSAPLVDNGLARAFKAGRIFQTLLPFRIHRVFVSPFLRCVQTASEVVAALCAVDVDANGKSSKDVMKLDPSKVKMLNKEAIRDDVAPKDGKFRFDVPQLESMIPSGTLDPSVERVYKESHMGREGVGVSVSGFSEKTTVVDDVEYCSYLELRRSMSSKNGLITAGNFEVLTKSGQTGITFN
ncbi:putative Myb-like HTH transcriptional regulator family protein [Hibiscus syriacus]|uniref:Myb-like HTH transcriptional regulator family protein n=1 Tax=Hibiscus syriacus TaxID=106335 RepID=A0A6A2WLA6_HIBSY|nr:putative Myb-like HTH transcriptional regulator family protein [Hibiscus syriacus]